MSIQLHLSAPVKVTNLETSARTQGVTSLAALSAAELADMPVREGAGSSSRIDAAPRAPALSQAAAAAAAVPPDGTSGDAGQLQKEESGAATSLQSTASATAATGAMPIGHVSTASSAPSASMTTVNASTVAASSAQPAAVVVAVHTDPGAASNTVDASQVPAATHSTVAVAASAAQAVPLTTDASALSAVIEPAAATTAMTAVAAGQTYDELTSASHLTFDDEFNTFNSSPDGSSGWMTSYPWYGEDARTSPSNGEAEYYSDPSVGTNPFSDVNGVLNITATVAKSGSNPYGLPYTSGIITSDKSLAQTYGYFEIRAELPAGQGLWPAFWLFPTALPTTSELDVFEVLGNAPTTLYSTVHTYPVGGVWSEDSQELTVANTSTGFNTYGVDWEPTTITFYMNGQVIATAPTPSTMHAPMYMLANLAVGGPTSWPGAPSSNSEFPATYKIDYIRSYATPATIEVSGTQAILTSAITGQLLLDGRGSAGTTVNLESAGGFVVKTVETSASGSFGFTGLSAGDYQVEFVPPTGQTLASGGPANATTGLTSTLVLADGQTLTLAAESLTPPQGVITPISMTPSTGAVTTTDAATAKPFADVVINDANVEQAETVSVTLSSASNGTLSDPNAAADGSTIAGGVWNVSGSSTAVAAALDDLVFTPTAHQVAPGSAVTTTITAAIKDTAGETTDATSEVIATAVASLVSITPTTEAVATADTAGVKPFTGIAIIDPNAGQTETAKVTLSDTGNGTLSDPNAATDGSTVANGVWIASGSSAQVATDLDDLVFDPMANQVAAGSAVTTHVSAAVTDTAGSTASVVSTVTATQLASVSIGTPSADTLALQISEDAWKGDAQFLVSVDGKQVGGDYSASVLHSTGDAGTFLLTGDWGSGVNDVQVSFINDAYGGTPTEDRNLYVNSVAYDGVTDAGTSASMFSDGTDTVAVGGSTATASGPADHLTLNLSENPWQGNAEFILYIDGKAVTTAQAVTALHSQNATQAVSFSGNFGAGTHTIGVALVNDAYGGSPSEDRNLYIDGITLNGAAVFSCVKAQDTDGVSNFTFVTTH